MAEDPTVRTKAADPKVILCGGGTAGHVYPALALAEQLRQRSPDLSLLYVGTRRGLEADVVPREGLEFCAIEAEGLPRRPSPALARAFLRLSRGFFQSRRIVRQFKPDVVVGMGGFVSAPMVFAAHRAKVPTLIHEQNSVPGAANRWAARFADAVAATYPGAEKWFGSRPVRLVGNPVRSQILNVARESRSNRFGFVEGRKTLLIFGGSQGAVKINTAVIEGLPLAADEAWLQILHVAGKMDFDRVEARTQDLGLGGSGLIYQCVPYIDGMGEAYRAADLVVCRAGATSIAETTALGIPTILVPYPHATANHQEKNARFVEEAGGARVILDSELDGAALLGAATQILRDEALLASMRAGAAGFGRPNAAVELADMVFNLVGS